MENEKQKLEELIQKSSNIVFFGGAGVSTESGIPDFRSVDGLYHQQYKYPPEEILSHTFFEEKTEEFYDFYRKKTDRDRCQAQRRASAAGQAGKAGQAAGHHHPEH